MNDSPDERLVALEIRLAHHERMAEEISEVMIRQGRMVDGLLAEVRRLRDRLGEIESGGLRAPQDEPPPPHY